MKNMKCTKGITLIELMVTLGILAILIAVGLPRLQNTSQSSRLSSSINSLSGDFAFARSEAVTRNMTVRVTSNNGNDWSAGWIVETVPTAGAPTIIRNGQPLAANILLNGDAGTLTYNSDGTQTAGELKFKTCKSGDTTSHGREIQVVPTGRIKLVKGQGCP